MAFSQIMVTFVVKQEINILLKTKQAATFPQIFPNWRLFPNRQSSLDF
jgi:hypothetical protein